MSVAPPSHEISDLFVSKWMPPIQRQLDTLTVRLGVPIEALMHDHDHSGFPMGMLRVERSGGTFDFSDNPEIKPICGFLCRDRWGDAQDIAAWSPRDGWTGTLLGRATLLTEYELTAPRGDAPLPVYLGVLSWLRAYRSGCVILNARRARRELDGIKMAAASVDEGLAIRRMLSAPEPRIVVPARATIKEAA